MAEFTYFLDSMSSDSYYLNVAAFTDEVLRQGEIYLGRVMSDFSERSGRTEAAPEHRQELLLELLVLGVIRQVYGRRAAGIHPVVRSLLCGLTELQLRGKGRRGAGVLAGCLRGLYNGEDRQEKNTGNSLAELRALWHWLGTVDDFCFERKKAGDWLAYFDKMPQGQAEQALGEIMAFAVWFEGAAQESLGGYTQRVEHYLQGAAGRRWREDYFFCHRLPVEYHLNMVGAEMMNRVLRQNFLSMPEKIVLLPGCMCARQGKKCGARPGELGYSCVGCTPACRVNRITRLGKFGAFSVCIVPHTSSLFQIGKGDAVKNAGVVGVACVTNLLKGGWMLTEAGIPAQCVLLEFSGCRRHWHKQGMTTDISMKRLLEVLQVNDDS